MKQNLIADYLSCILFRVVSFFTFFLPLNFSLFLGRRLGDLIYLFDRRHRAVAQANIRKTVSDNLDCASSARITRQAYQAFGQNLTEISIIPRVNKHYLEKYIHIENKDYIQKAFNRGKGVIFLIVHEGNWELSNIICANLGFPFVLFVRDQGFPRLNELLNYYRLKQGAKIIHKNTGVRQLIEVLKSNQSIGMTTDQGGRYGQLVNFFGKEASMSTGAVRLALKYDCAIIPVFYTRIKGPYTKVILDQVFTATPSADPQNDLRQNLQRLISIYEKYIRQYPHEYLWTYKIFKYGKEKEIMILGDGKTGHLRQSESVAKLVIQQLASRGIKLL
ncbi:MAG: lysophospholipid acyltransferase family protein [Candidatus Omnitrophica bacterium]|nr:lysophospholipid acyltransferase family protein [Candidatus Omnitrophota bacterium]